LRLISDALAYLLEAKDPTEIIRELLPRVARHLDTDTYFNFMVTPEGDTLELAAFGGLPETDMRKFARLKFGPAICGMVALTRQPIHATDIQNSGYDKAELVRQFGIQAYACNPFIVGGRLLGTLSFATRTRKEFQMDELEFMRSISRYVALAIDRARSQM